MHKPVKNHDPGPRLACKQLSRTRLANVSFV